MIITSNGKSIDTETGKEVFYSTPVFRTYEQMSDKEKASLDDWIRGYDNGEHSGVDCN